MRPTVDYRLHPSCSFSIIEHGTERLNYRTLRTPCTCTLEIVHACHVHEATTTQFYTINNKQTMHLVLYRVTANKQRSASETLCIFHLFKSSYEVNTTDLQSPTSCHLDLSDHRSCTIASRQF